MYLLAVIVGKGHPMTFAEAFITGKTYPQLICGPLSRDGEGF